MATIPIKTIVIDPTLSSADVLVQTLRSMHETVLSADRVSSLSDANTAILNNDINTIFIDPIALGLDAASTFIFDIRKRLPHIPFVLYIDFSRMAHMRSHFFQGERQRFQHYYMLDKLNPAGTFVDEVKAVVRNCQGYLSYKLRINEINTLQSELSSTIQNQKATEFVTVSASMMKEIQELLSSLKAQQKRTTRVKPKTVFLSYRFAESDYLDGLQALLQRDGFSIVTGQNANTYISQAILERIKSCEFFLCLMTQADEKIDGTFTTSPWLLEEKGAAIALGKKIVLMVEEGVTDIGGLQGDWQRINFTARSFTSAVIRAVDQLKSFSGTEEEERNEIGAS